MANMGKDLYEASKLNIPSQIQKCIQLDANLFYKNEHDNTAFMYLCMYGRYDEIHMLIDKNVLPKSYYFIKNVDGHLAFEYLPKKAVKTNLTFISKLFMMDYSMGPVLDLKKDVATTGTNFVTEHKKHNNTISENTKQNKIEEFVNTSTEDQMQKHIQEQTQTQKEIQEHIKEQTQTQKEIQEHIQEQTQEHIQESFRFYTIDEFSFYNTQNQIKGCYSEILYCLHKATQTKMIIKRTFPGSDYFEPAIKEISLLRFINKIDPTLAVHLYGVVYCDSTLYLVEECLSHTLDFRFKYETGEEHNRYCLQLLLNLSHRLNGLGIAHNDLKSQNVMFTDDGVMKLIDFGLSDHLGLYPNTAKTKMYIAADGIKAPETDGFMNIAGNIIETYKTRSLNTDIYSIGSIFLNVNNESNPKGKWVKYINYENKIYSCVLHRNKANVFKESQIENNDFYKFLFKLVEFDPLKRPYPKTALSILNNKLVETNSSDTNNSPGINLSEINGSAESQDLSEINSSGANVPSESQNLSRTNEHILFSQYPNNKYSHDLEGELFYKEEIFNSIQTICFTNVKDVRDDLMFTQTIKTIVSVKFKEVNTIVNSIYLFRVIVELGIQKHEYMLYMLACIKINSLKYEQYMSAYNYESLRSIYKINFNGATIENYVHKIVSSPELTTYAFNFIPVYTALGYLLYKLQVSNIDHIVINDISTHIVISLIKYVCYEDNLEIPIWNLVLKFYNTYKELHNTLILPTY